MTPTTTAARAVLLAGRRRGVTADELADAAGVSLKVAQRTLAALARAGLLAVDVPEREGKRRGDWHNTYRLQREGKGKAATDGRPGGGKKKRRTHGPTKRQ